MFGLQLERECAKCGGAKLQYSFNYFAQEVYIDEIFASLETDVRIEDITASFIKKVKEALVS